MKIHCVIIYILVLIFVTCFVSAVPVAETSVGEQSEIRTKRDLNGVFDSISNGFESLMQGARKVSNSVMESFNNIFSSSNMNAISDGFEKFGKGLRDAVKGMWGKTKDGFNKIEIKIKKGWNGKDDGSKSPAVSTTTTTTPAPPEKTHPEGEVPEEETT